MILIKNAARGFKLPQGFSATMRQLFLLLKIPRSVEVSVVFVNPQVMRRLNRRYRRQDRLTNVLSFGCNPGERRAILKSSRGMLGEIFIAPSVARREAAAAGIAFNQQLTRLMVHAILHLLGYEHGRSRMRRRMERKEQEILRKLR